MTREIVFRAWDKVLNQFLPNVQNHIGNGEWAFGNLLKDDRYIVQQFTGLKDDNGVEIYEGDIIEIAAYYYGDTFVPITTSYVTFSEGSFCMKTENNEYYHFYECNQGYKVVGNMWQNPFNFQD